MRCGNNVAMAYFLVRLHKKAQGEMQMPQSPHFLNRKREDELWQTRYCMAKVLASTFFA